MTWKIRTDIFMNNETSEYENYRKIIFFRQITSLKTSANLLFGEARYNSKTCSSRHLCANFLEPFFISLQHLPNNREHFIYKFSLIHLFFRCWHLHNMKFLIIKMNSLFMAFLFLGQTKPWNIIFRAWSMMAGAVLKSTLCAGDLPDLLNLDKKTNLKNYGLWHSSVSMLNIY